MRRGLGARRQRGPRGVAGRLSRTEREPCPLPAPVTDNARRCRRPPPQARRLRRRRRPDGQWHLRRDGRRSSGRIQALSHPGRPRRPPAPHRRTPRRVALRAGIHRHDVARAGRVLVLEADAFRRVAERLGPAFSAAVRLLEKATGRLIVSGVGKSGLIARKIAATLTSTGSPASFLHPVDSLHGDLGLVGREDVAILLSKSGASDELFGLVGQLKRLGVPIIALTGDPDSPLARQSDVVLDASVTEEACPETLAPTTSTTAALALGDALAVTLLEVKGFRREQFAALHPGGTLGRHLLLRVADVMLAGNVPALGPDCPMRECVVLLAEKRGTVAVVDAAGSLVGVVTAGDLTRLMERTDQFLDIPVRDVMTRTPKSTTADELAGAAVRLMEQHGIMALPVLDGGRRLVGMVHLHDLMKAGAA